MQENSRSFPVKLLTDQIFLLAIFAGFVFWSGYYLVSPQPGMIDGHLSFVDYSLTHVLMMVVFYPFVEEAAFRGWLQGILLNYMPLTASYQGISLANVLTSLVFVGLHSLYHPVFWALAVFFPSLVFGLFREKYQSIKPSIILHSFYNSGFYVLLAL